MRTLDQENWIQDIEYHLHSKIGVILLTTQSSFMFQEFICAKRKELEEAGCTSDVGNLLNEIPKYLNSDSGVAPSNDDIESATKKKKTIQDEIERRKGVMQQLEESIEQYAKESIFAMASESQEELARVKAEYENLLKELHMTSVSLDDAVDLEMSKRKVFRDDMITKYFEKTLPPVSPSISLANNSLVNYAAYVDKIIMKHQDDLKRAIIVMDIIASQAASEGKESVDLWLSMHPQETPDFSKICEIINGSCQRIQSYWSSKNNVECFLKNYGQSHVIREDVFEDPYLSKFVDRRGFLNLAYDVCSPRPESALANLCKLKEELLRHGKPRGLPRIGDVEYYPERGYEKAQVLFDDDDFLVSDKGTADWKQVSSFNGIVLYSDKGNAGKFSRGGITFAYQFETAKCSVISDHLEYFQYKFSPLSNKSRQIRATEKLLIPTDSFVLLTSTNLSFSFPANLHYSFALAYVRCEPVLRLLLSNRGYNILPIQRGGYTGYRLNLWNPVTESDQGILSQLQNAESEWRGLDAGTSIVES